MKKVDWLPNIWQCTVALLICLPYYLVKTLYQPTVTTEDALNSVRASTVPSQPDWFMGLYSTTGGAILFVVLVFVMFGRQILNALSTGNITEEEVSE